MDNQSDSYLSNIAEALEPLRTSLRHHDLYRNLRCIADIRVFMENHVFAVWDFMSLLKSPQMHLTQVRVPWTPVSDPSLARFINEIVREEESDVNEEGVPLSHFEMYVDAMRQLGADTSAIDIFIRAVESGQPVQSAFHVLSLPEEVVDFVNYTFSIIETGQPHLIAAAFTFGREDLIPDMFLGILQDADASNEQYTKFHYYLQRHIELDGEDHGPLAMQMISVLCGTDEVKWQEVSVVARQALSKRIAFWNAINQQLIRSSADLVISLT